MMFFTLYVERAEHGLEITDLISDNIELRCPLGIDHAGFGVLLIEIIVFDYYYRRWLRSVLWLLDLGLFVLEVGDLVLEAVELV